MKLSLRDRLLVADKFYGPRRSRPACLRDNVSVFLVVSGRLVDRLEALVITLEVCRHPGTLELGVRLGSAWPQRPVVGHAFFLFLVLNINFFYFFNWFFLLIVVVNYFFNNW